MCQVWSNSSKCRQRHIHTDCLQPHLPSTLISPVHIQLSAVLDIHIVPTMLKYLHYYKTYNDISWHLKWTIRTADLGSVSVIIFWGSETSIHWVHWEILKNPCWHFMPHSWRGYWHPPTRLQTVIIQNSTI
jgi:hypothetical protein